MWNCIVRQFHWTALFTQLLAAALVMCSCLIMTSENSGILHPNAFRSSNLTNQNDVYRCLGLRLQRNQACGFWEPNWNVDEHDQNDASAKTCFGVISAADSSNTVSRWYSQYCEPGEPSQGAMNVIAALEQRFRPARQSALKQVTSAGRNAILQFTSRKHIISVPSVIPKSKRRPSEWIPNLAVLFQRMPSIMSLHSRYVHRPVNTQATSLRARLVRHPRASQPVFKPHNSYVSLGHHVKMNATAPGALSLLDSSRPIRMDQKRIILIDGLSAEYAVHDPLNTQSISDRSYYIESGNGNGTSEDRYPVLSFRYVEPHTIELLIVVTETMRQYYGTQINEYLASTMTTVSSLLRHPSLKASIQLKIVDIILLDRVYALRHQLEDWSYSKQEQVMTRFCRWVNRLRTSKFNWDSAILLNVGHFKSTALGVAHYRSMCSVETACLAVLDRGFGTGHIIAHELGHQLGAKHDFELNSDCGMDEQQLPYEGTQHSSEVLSNHRGTSVDEFEYPQHYWPPVRLDELVRRDTIMSGTLYFDHFPLRWSACSRQAIHDFLESNVASCLRIEEMPEALHTPEWLAKRSQHDLPGTIFTLDQQCLFVLKEHSTRFCGHLLPVCGQLYCKEGENGACLPMEAAWAEGSPCGDGKWCIKGQCVPLSQKPVRVDGSWGPWGPWSACSRSCGGGVRFSERECNNPEPKRGGSFCHGTRVRMRSCAIQPCEQNFDIRQKLCDQVGRQYGTQLEAYVPKLGEATACSLTCLENGQSVHHRLSIPDGTPCYALRDDICIKGQCWETGCDGVLGSTQRFDRCRVCGGDNTSCVEVNGIFNGDSVESIGVHPRGLITAVRIPRGVTNAFVRKESPRTTPYSSDSYDDFMLLIFEELKTQIRRGETREPFAGAELYYSGSRKAEEVVSITGRLQKDVNIVIRVENSQTSRPLPTIEYRYYVDKSQRHNPLYFIAEEEARIAAQRENKRIGRSKGHPKVKLEPLIQPSSGGSSDRDEHERRPELDDRPKVHFVWRISELPTGCNTCAGNSTSHAECYPLVNDVSARQAFSEHDFFRPVADYLCSAMPRPPPVFRRCADYCGVRWSLKPLDTSENGDELRCPARCGRGLQPSVHVCEEFVVPAEQPDKSKGLWRPAQLGERACLRAGLGNAPKEPTEIPCQGSCNPVFWIATNWTACSVTCGIGERRREIRCREHNGVEWSLAECFSLTDSDEQASAPEGAISNQIAQGILKEHISDARLQSQIGKLTVFDQSESCMSLLACQERIQWSTSSWSHCELMTDEMKVLCRTVDQRDAHGRPQLQPIGMRTRQVYCQFNEVKLHPTLHHFLQDVGSGAGPPWNMNLDFCRKASQYGTIGEEPTNRESCERPFCYRWGEVRLTECSTTCGPGIRSATVPCERITLDLVSKSTERNQISNTHVYRVEQTAPEECHSNLGYSPRIFLAENNQTIHVETAERPFGEQRGTELTQMFANNVVQLPCTNKPCAVSIPVWHTTSWDECSVTCGGGVRRRQVLCMLETHYRTTDETKGRTDYHLRQNTNVVVADQIKAEVADPQRCHDAGLPRPSDTETCNASPCPEWMADNWGPCDGICEYGVQHRHVRCVLDAYTSPPASTNPSVERSHALLFAGSHGSYSTRTHRSVQQFREVNPELCEAVSAKPSTKRLCLITSGCPFWFYGEWSPCSVHCGVGQRIRKVDCRFPNGTLVHDSQSSWSKRNGKHTVHHGVTLDSIIQFVETNSKIPSCLAPPPVEEMSCKTRPCTGTQPFWWPVMVSECDSRTCEIGRRSRVVKCLSSSHGQLSESSCQHITHPTTWTPCVPFKCMKFHWSADPWSSCPRGCGIRTRYRRVRCVDPFGEEYSDSLCQAHLKPKNWDLCPDRCMSVPRSCSEIRKLHTNPKDGTFQIFIGIVPTSIFCADMDTSNPKEYVVLQRVNYARTGAFMSPSASSPWCPSASNTNSLSSSRNLHLPAEVPITIDTNNLTEFEGVFHRKVTAANCQHCDYLPHLSSVTYYQKIRLDVRALKVDVEDTRFAYTIGPTSVPYATAKDCFGSSSCPQGEFQIDLRGTGLRVSVKTHWAQSSPDSVSHIHRSEKGQLVTGHCGGYCSGCWPRPDLILDVVDDMSR